MNKNFDILVIGGGINGAGVARDAAGRGLSVMLAERGDYAQATSSASSKLIHGGLRYLEHYEFRLVHEALSERAVLMGLAPHLVRPLRFLLPVRGDAPRPAWEVRLGLLLYDKLGDRGPLPRTGRLDPAEWPRDEGLKLEGVRAILHYPDCQVDDSRLVVETLLDARARGADIANERAVVGAERREDGYAVTLAEGGARRVVNTRFLVNAAGPWANRVHPRLSKAPPAHRLRLVRGSHIVIARDGDDRGDAFILQLPDRRVVFVIPWLGRFRLVGTTDIPHEGDPERAICTEAETDYLLAAYNAHFTPAVRRDDIVWSFAGVRPLVDDGATKAQAVTRDSSLDLAPAGRGGLLTIYGGKLTTHRILAEKVMARLAAAGLAMGRPWTASAPVHGGALDRAALAALARRPPAGIPAAIARRWAFTYGSETETLFAAVRSDPGLAEPVAPGVPEAELRHTVEVEDARSSEDFLLRRTKLLLDLDAGGREAIARWFGEAEGRRAAERP